MALDGAQLVAGDRLLDRQPALEPAHPQPGAVELVATQADGLADPEAVAVHHQQEQVVAHAVPSGPGGVQQLGHLAGGQVILVALVPVGGRGGAGRLTLDLSPFGRLRRHRRNPLLA